MTRTTAWFPVLTFALLATLISGLFRLGFLDFYNRDTLHFLFALAGVTVFVGWGPAVAAGLTRRLFREPKSDISFIGQARPGPFYMAFIPALLLGGVGIPNNYSMNADIYIATSPPIDRGFEPLLWPPFGGFGTCGF